MAEPPEITPEDLALIRRLPEIIGDVSKAVNTHQAVIENAVALVKNIPSSIGSTVVEAVSPIVVNAVTNLRDELIKTRSEIMDRIDRLQGTVDLVREDTRVRFQARLALEGPEFRGKEASGGEAVRLSPVRHRLPSSGEIPTYQSRRR
jgi:hypothetical protein